MKNFKGRKNMSNICMHDNILDQITFEELVVTIQSNEPQVSKEVIEKVFEELLNAKIEDAKYMLEKHMSFIKKSI